MKNILFSFGPFHIYSYGLMIAIGILSACAMAEKRAPQKNFSPDDIFSLAITCALSGILGAKLLYYITILPEILADPSVIFSYLTEGFVVYGGIVIGILGGFLFCRFKKANFLKTFDLVMPSVAFAQGFGRIGCFLAGCCYGVQTDSAFSVIFPEGSIAPAGIPLVPTQLISSGLDFLNCAVLLLFDKKLRTGDGQTACLYLIFYSVGRFFLEFWRGDLYRGFVGSLSTSQFISVILFVISLTAFVILRLRSKKARPEEKAMTD